MAGTQSPITIESVASDSLIFDATMTRHIDEPTLELHSLRIPEFGMVQPVTARPSESISDSPAIRVGMAAEQSS